MLQVDEVNAIYNRAINDYKRALAERIKQKIITMNSVCDETAYPELAIANRALEEVIEMIEQKPESDEARVQAAIQMGFLKKK